MRRIATVGLAFLAAASLASAEVRLARSGNDPDVQVIVTPAGPWSPVGRIDSRALNPRGDLRGDGSPAILAAGSRVLVAWTSREPVLQLALGDTEWHALPPIALPSRGSTPVLAAIGTAWVVAWSDSTSHDTQLALVLPNGDIRRSATIGGDLLRLSVQAKAAHVLTLRGGEIGLATVLIHVPEPEPTPFLVVGQWTLMAHVPDEAGALDLGFDVIADDDVTALTWWPDDRTLAYVELTDDGPDLPVRTLRAHGNGEGRPASLEREALRDLGAR